MDEWKVLGEGRIGGGRFGERGPIVIVNCWFSFLWNTPSVKDIVAKPLQIQVRVGVEERRALRPFEGTSVSGVATRTSPNMCCCVLF